MQPDETVFKGVVMMIKLLVDNKEVLKENPIVLEDLANELGIEAYCATVDNRLRELTYQVSKDAEINFLDLTSVDTITLYSASLRYVIAMAIKNIYPDSRVIFNQSISRSIFCDIRNIGKINNSVLEKIKAEVDRIIAADYPIRRVTVAKAEALEIYKNLGYEDKAEILAYRPEDTVHFYACNGYLNYMFGYMVPSTRYLKAYKLRLYAPGIIIQTPRAELGGIIPEFEDAPTFGQVLRQANHWGEICKGSYVAQMNKLIETQKELEFINLCETRHNDQLAELGLKIKNDIENIRLIAIAGPSSSGKTTFTNRLRIELMARGITPLMISIDDYYLSREAAPKDEDGKPDLEHLNALDIDLFNDQMFSLINGEEVQLPIFNFQTGKREWGKVVQIDQNTPILIEGIHALNDDLTPSIPAHQKFKIYIAPQAQLHLDDQNPISITEIRLLRRLVRDKKFRNSPAEETLSMWPSVRRGEFRWIYKNQEGVNYVFNSELTYELCVLKKYALPMLEAIDHESPYFVQANRLVKFLKYFKDIEDTWIPCNSILREFIGGSSFYRK